MERYGTYRTRLVSRSTGDWERSRGRIKNYLIKGGERGGPGGPLAATDPVDKAELSETDRVCTKNDCAGTSAIKENYK